MKKIKLKLSYDDLLEFSKWLSESIRKVETPKSLEKYAVMCVKAAVLDWYSKKVYAKTLFRYDGVVSFPLSDTIAISLAYLICKSELKHNGYMDNLLLQLLTSVDKRYKY